MATFSSGYLQAATKTWTGLGADNNWNTTLNWDTGVPVNNDSLVFSGATRISNTNNIANLILSGLSFTGSGFTLGGNSLTNTGGVYDSSGNNTNALIISLGAAQSFTNAAPSTTLLFGGAITNNGYPLTIGGDGNVFINGLLGGTNTASLAATASLLMDGNGTLRLAGANNFAGGLTINAGMVQIANAAAIPSGTGKGDVTVNAGAILNLNGNSQTINGLYGAGTVDNQLSTATGTYTLTVGNNSTNSAGTFSGMIQNSYGAVALTKVTTNLFTFNSSMTYAGSTTISAGTLALGASAYLGSTPSITVSPGALFDISASTFSLGSAQTLTAGRTTNDGPADVKGPLSTTGTIAIYKPGAAGTLTLSSDLTLLGGTFNFDLGNTTTLGGGVNDLIALNGTLNLGSATILFNPLAGSFAAGPYLLISNAQANVTGSTASLTTDLPRGLSVTLDAATKPGSLYATISGTATPATLVWSAASSADWDVKTMPNWLNGSTADYFYNLDNVSFNDATANGTMNLPTGVSPTTTTFNNLATNYVLNGAGAIGGTGDLTLNGGGTVTLNTANKYAGDTIINNGSTLISGVLAASPHITVYNGVSTLGNLRLGGGGFYLSDNANDVYRANFNNLILNPGAGSVSTRSSRQSSSTPWIQFNTVSRSGPGGTVDFNNIQSKASSPQCGLFITNTTTVNGILGGFATIFENDWVVPSATGAGSSAYAAYQTSTTPSTWGSSSNIALSASTAANVNTTNINSLKLVGPATVTINAGQALTLSSGGLLVPGNAAGASTITGGTLLGATNLDLIVLQHSGVNALTIASVIADNTNGAATSGSALTKSGQGRLVLTGNNTYTGPTFINGPSLSSANNNTPGKFATGTLQIGNAGTTGSIDASSGVTNNAVLAFNRSDAISFASPISGNGALKVLSGNVTLTGNNSYKGVTTISAGTLQIGNGGTVGSLGSSSSIANNGALVFNHSDNVSFAGPVGGSGSLTQQGAGRLTLGSADTCQGTTAINSGTLALGASASISNSTSIVVAGGASFDVSAVSGFTLNGTPVNQVLSGSGTVFGSLSTAPGTSVTPATVGTIGTLAFANNFIINGGNLNFDINGASRDLITVSGDLTLTAGTVQLNITGGTLANGSYRLIQYSGTLGGAAANLAVGGFAQPGQVANLSDATPGEIDLVVSSYAGLNLTWVGDGTKNFWDVTTTADWLNGATASVFHQFDNVTFDDSSTNPTVDVQATVAPGSVTVNAAANNYIFQGPGKISNGSSLSKAGASTLTILTTNDTTGGTTISGGTVQVGNGIAAGSLGSGPVTDNTALVFNEPDDTTVNNAISGSGSLTHQGAMTLVLAANNSHGGGTTISAGPLQVGIGGGAGSLGSGPVTNNGTLTINRSGLLTLNSAISGSGPLIVDGPGTVTLGGANTYQNNTYISNGVVKLGASEVIPDGGSTTGWLILDGGASTAGTLNLNGFNETVNALSGVGGTVLGQVVNDGGSGINALIVNGTANTTFAGRILDNTGTGGKVALVNAGASTLTLTPGGLGNTFSGGTTISNGIVSGGSSTTANATMLGTGPVNFYDNGALQLGGFTGSTSPDYGAFVNPVILAPNAASTVYGTCRGGGFTPSSVTGPASSTLTFVARYVRGGFGGNWTGFNGLLVVSNTAASGNNDFRLNTAIGFPNARVHLAVGGGGGAYVYNLVSGTPTIPIGELTGEAGTTIALNSGSASGQAAIWSVGGLNTTAQFDGIITDTHGIIKAGTGRWTLTGANTYSGVTAVTNGVLAFANDTAASPNTSQFRARSASAVFDVTAMTGGTLNVGAGQNIGGIGIVWGSVNASGTVQPGSSGTTGIFTVTNAVTLGGETLINLNRTNSPNSGRLVAATIAYGGTLTVTNAGNTLQGGDTFQLFSGALSGSFAATNLPALALGLSWDVSKLNVNGTLSVAGQIIPPLVGPVEVLGTTNIISGTNGTAGATFRMLTSTNVALPLASWTLLGTGTFAVDGSFAYTNSFATNALQFYDVEEVLP